MEEKNAGDTKNISIDTTYMEKQIKETYKKAFRDLLHERVKQEPPDYEWITRLYSEIKERLIKLLRKESKLYKEIDEKLDVQLFNQMISHNAFSGSDFYSLIQYVFDTCIRLGSPQRDNDTKNKKQEVLDVMNNGGTFADIVVIFIENANNCIDSIYEDIANLYKDEKKDS